MISALLHLVRQVHKGHLARVYVLEHVAHINRK